MLRLHISALVRFLVRLIQIGLERTSSINFDRYYRVINIHNYIQHGHFLLSLRTVALSSVDVRQRSVCEG